jgi:type I restriction enzyme M protein
VPKRPLNKADFLKRRALMLPKEARYNELMRLPKGEDFGAAIVAAMDAIEREFEPLAGQLPKDYGEFEPSVLENLHLRQRHSANRRRRRLRPHL